jgi:hypothetical protein
MRNSIEIPLILLSFAASTCPAQTSVRGSIPKFSDYQVNQLYKGKNATPTVTDDWHQFRTLIREGASRPVNFAGDYRIVEWGCGTDCVRFVLLDLRAGSVYDPPFESLWLDAFPTNGWYGKGLEFHANSRLLIVNGCPTEKCGTYYYEWTGEVFQLIRTATERPKD